MPVTNYTLNVMESVWRHRVDTEFELVYLKKNYNLV